VVRNNRPRPDMDLLDAPIPEPSTRFTWVRDGETVTATLTDWAAMWESDYYDKQADLTRDLLTWDGIPGTACYHRVQVSLGMQREDDRYPYHIMVPGFPDQVIVIIDGRA
jgi:hypothetical protein